MGGGSNPNHITPQDLMKGLKEEEEHFMKEEQVGIDPSTDKLIPLPPFKNEAIGMYWILLQKIQASKFQPLIDPKIEKILNDTCKKTKINVSQIAMAGAQLCSKAEWECLLVLTYSSSENAATQEAKDEAKFKAEQEQLRKACGICQKDKH